MPFFNDSLTPRAVDLRCLPEHTAPAAQPPASEYMSPTSGQANNQASRLMVRRYADDTYPDGLTLWLCSCDAFPADVIVRQPEALARGTEYKALAND